MKFRLTMKDPDGVTDSLRDAVKKAVDAIVGLSDAEKEVLTDLRYEEIYSIAGKWLEYGEYLTIEIDTLEKTAVVVERK